MRPAQVGTTQVRVAMRAAATQDKAEASAAQAETSAVLAEPWAGPVARPTTLVRLAFKINAKSSSQPVIKILNAVQSLSVFLKSVLDPRLKMNCSNALLALAALA